MTGHRSRFLERVAAALLAVSVLSGTAFAQGGLGARLDEAEKKLDSDQQNCRPINLAEYAQLLQEASKNKKLAQKAAKAGAPPNPQVDQELGKAMMLFARAQAAQAMQCMQAAQAQPQAQVTHEQLEQLPVGHRPEDLVASCPPDTFPTITRSPAVSLTCAAPADAAMVEVYRTHNRVRSEYGAPPLVRDPALELDAGEYAGELVTAGRPVHASRAGRGNIRENISQGLSWWSPGQLMQTWLRERGNFVPGTFPNVSRTHNWYDIGHWAQMIWIRTVLIGCARSAGISASFLVCRYGPGGNRDGELVGIPPRQYSVVAPTLPRTEVYGPASTPAPTPGTTATSPSGSTPTSTPTSPETYPGTYSTDDVKGMVDQYNLAVHRYDEARTNCDAVEMQRAGSIIEVLGPRLQAISEAMKETGKFSKYSAIFADFSIAVIDVKLKEIEAAKKKSSGKSTPPDPPLPTTPPPPPLPDTKIAPPDLPKKEVYNPADLPQCPLEIM